MEILKAGISPNFGTTKTSYSNESKVEDAPSHKEISKKGIAIAAAAITAAGIAAIAITKKIKAKDCKELMIVPGKVASEPAKLNIAKLKALPKETQIEIKALLKDAVSSDEYSSILKKYNLY